MAVSVLDSRAAVTRPDEYDDILQLLIEHRSCRSSAEVLLAQEIAEACLGDKHLWQDLGLPDRQHLSEMLEEHFHPLFILNSGNMKWKKFFYKQLCERIDVHVCRAPSCEQCTDYDNCFGPELAGTRSM